MLSLLLLTSSSSDLVRYQRLVVWLLSPRFGEGIFFSFRTSSRHRLEPSSFNDQLKVAIKPELQFKDFSDIGLYKMKQTSALTAKRKKSTYLLTEAFHQP